MAKEKSPGSKSRLERAEAEIKFLERRLAFVKKHVRPRVTGEVYYLSDDDLKFFNSLFDLKVFFDEE